MHEWLLQEFFVNIFSFVAPPLTRLLYKETKCNWSEHCEESFNKIKNMLVNAPVLCTPDFGKKFNLYVEASHEGVG